MAWLVGLITPEERRELEKRGWVVEQASKYKANELVEEPEEGSEFEACAVYVDSNLSDILMSHDWSVDD
jgi:hypothetical protein